MAVAESKRRSLRFGGIDLIRGLCLVEMMANHLPRCLPVRAAVETTGFISAAEGFVLLAGFVGGYTSATALASGKPMKFLRRRAFGRMTQLYSTYLGMLTVVLTLIALDPSRFREWRILARVGSAPLDQVWLYAAAGFHLAMYFDIFIMYCVFLMLMPLIIGQMRDGRSWLILSVSLGVWLASQFWQDPSPGSLADLGYFNLFAWQLLFTVGVMAGYRQLEAPISIPDSRWILWGSACVCGLLFVLRDYQRVGVHLPATLAFDLPHILTDKPALGAIRLLNLAAMAYCIWTLFRRFGPQLQEQWACRKLTFLGQHSLQVFSWSVGVSYLMFLFGESWQNRPVAFQLALLCMAIFSLWLPAQAHAAWRSLRTSRTRMSRGSLVAT